MRQELHHLVRLQRRESGTRLDLSRCFDSSPGLTLRKRQVYRRMRRLAASMSSEWIANERAIILADPNCGPSLRDAVCKELNAILDQQITPRRVCQLLGITNRERLKWTEDGRLPRSGMMIVKRWQKISLPTYSLREIAEIASNQELISSWRNDSVKE